MSDRQPPIISSSNSTSSALLPLWQQLQRHPQQKISTAPGWQEATMQAAINQQEGVVHPYPKRPGEPDCSYYMRTGLCGFGVNCKFNHPPISKLVLNSWVPGQFPERPGQPECQYYLKTGTCKFGFFCKYHHPKEKAGTAGGAQLNILHLPLRPGEKDCAFYLQTGNCKFGATCKFNHPPPLLPVPGGFVSSGASVDVPQFYPTTATYLRSPRPSYLESPRFTGPPNSVPPILTPPNQVSTAPWNSYQVPSLLQEGQQQQGLAGNSVHPALASFQDHFAVGLIPPLMPAGSASFNLTLSAASTPGQLEEGYPQRPGQQECSHYMKTGGCNYGQQCKFHHPRVRNTPSFSSHASSVRLPLRPGAAPCTFFSRFGFCKYGSACKFDHSLMQPAYGHEPSLMAATQITADGMPAAPSAPIISTFTEISAGQPSKSREDADTLSASIQQLDVQSDQHD